VRRDLTLLGVEGVEDRVGAGVHGEAIHRSSILGRGSDAGSGGGSGGKDRPSSRVPHDMNLSLPSTGTVTMYTTTWCGYCRRLKSQLDREGIAYTEVDIERRPDAADFVMTVNRGNQTVPTVVFPDGSAATNPSLHEVRDRLA
jgi:mycoredoxin